MKLAIMQPYFLPYVGYFQLLGAVDRFIVYDDIQLSRHGWVQRNRILVDGKPRLFSLPLKKDSDFLDINRRRLADLYDRDRDKILRVIRTAYGKAPFFSQAMPVVEECFCCGERNLFGFVFHSIRKIRDYLGLGTEIVVSSPVGVREGPTGQERVIALCRAMKADEYVNAIGGQALYRKEDFESNGIGLSFIKTGEFSYPQFGGDVVPNLSIIDLMMFNEVGRIRDFLARYTLI
jgi:hypothetical protein